jgi:hypothetical protein
MKTRQFGEGVCLITHCDCGYRLLIMGESQPCPIWPMSLPPLQMVFSRSNRVAPTSIDVNLLLLTQPGSLLSEFIVSRFSDPSGGVGTSAKALLALEERGPWESEKAANIVRRYMSSRFYPNRSIDHLVVFLNTHLLCIKSESRVKDTRFSS